jgi:hypothetical protein
MGRGRRGGSDHDFSSIELELFREFERSEMRRLEVRRSQTKRPLPTTTEVPRR